ncbi:MAG: carboxylesterase family protein [Alphaproteobacteria bacterium]
MKSAVSGALALAFLAAGFGAGAACADTKANVTGGTVVGESADGINSFKGIPYAAPPVGELRWKAPQPVAAWTGDKDATKFGDMCMQGRRGGGADAPGMSEDCLVLNVYAPANAKNAPVMVWIHGGSNTGGSGQIYNGAAFAKDGIVTVTVNYRLGALGFFGHPALTKAASATDPLANYGLMDQTAALQWVKANIKSFGGDPNHVTVFGESAGAIDIYALLGLKTSKGLFNQAILESNITWGDSAPLAKVEEAGKALAVRAGATDTATLADLRALPADKLISASQGAEFPMVDGRFMTETSLQAVANGHTLDIPTVIGTNSFEASLIAAREKDPQKLVDWTNAQAGATARFIATKTAGGKSTWLYFFSYLPTAVRGTERGANGAGHASEIAYVYGGMTRPLGGAGGATPPEPSADDKAMAVLMHSCWVAFAKSGAPKCASGPAWPKYDPKKPQLMEFGMPSGVRDNFRKTELDAATAAEPGAK